MPKPTRFSVCILSLVVFAGCGYDTDYEPFNYGAKCDLSKILPNDEVIRLVEFDLYDPRVDAKVLQSTDNPREYLKFLSLIKNSLEVTSNYRLIEVGIIKIQSQDQVYEITVLTTRRASDAPIILTFDQQAFELQDLVLSDLFDYLQQYLARRDHWGQAKVFIVTNISKRCLNFGCFDLAKACPSKACPRDRPSSIGLALHPYLLNTKDSGVFLVGCCT